MERYSDAEVLPMGMHLNAASMDAINKALADGTAVDTTAGPRPAVDPPDLKAMEKEFQDRVIKLAKRHNWNCYHTHDSRKSAAGYPDLTIVRVGGPLFFAELKREGEHPTAAQMTWLELIRSAGIAAYVWRPSDWPAIVEVLSRAARPSEHRGEGPAAAVHSGSGDGGRGRKGAARRRAGSRDDQR